MAPRTRVRTLPLAAVAAAGVVLGHWAAYRIGVPRAHLRDHILAQTGHAYWFLAVKGSVIAGLTGGGALFVRHLRAETRSLLSPVDAYSSIVVRLSVLQAIAFAATETLERVVSGAPVAGMFSHHMFVLGMAVQFLTACLGALLVLILCRSAELVGTALAARHPLRPARMRWGRGRTPAIAVAFLLGPSGPRAPPRS